jgi:hypothetical protein
MKQWILAVIAMGLSSPAWAQPTCEDLFHLRGVELSTTEYSLAQQMNPEFLNSLTLNILQMTSFSKSSVFNEKNVVEKGELVLAKPLNNGWSMEFEYAADYRGKTPVFRLKEIDLVKPNGEVTTLDKAPNNTLGDSLKKDFYAFEGMDASLADAKLSMPQAIHSPLFERITRWATLADYIKRDEVQGLKNAGDLKGMRGKVFVRSTIDYTNKVIKKQSFKFFLLGMAMYFYSQREVITNEIIKVDPWDKMKRMSDVGLSTDYMREKMSAQLTLIEKRPIMLKPVLPVDEELDYAQVPNVLQNLELLNRFERQEESKPVVAYFNGVNSSLSLLSFKKINTVLLDDISDADAAILIYFPKTRRIVIISSQWMSFNASSDFVLPFLLEPGSKINGDIFERLEAKLYLLNQKKDKK